MQVSIAADTARLKLDLERERDRLTRVARRVVYELAHRAVLDIKADMPRTFDRPTPWVVNGVYVAPLRSENSATVDWKPGSAGSTPAEKILRAQIEGGQRNLKRFERLFALRPGYSVVPGKWAELDQYGNIKPSQLVQILSFLRLFSEVGFTANRSRRLRNRGRRTRAGAEYFIRPIGATQATHPSTWHLPPGVYRVDASQGGAPLLVLAFVRAARYRPRFAPARIVRETVARDASEVWNLGLARQLPFRR
jgi:hypothetical protein